MDELYRRLFEHVSEIIEINHFKPLDPLPGYIDRDLFEEHGFNSLGLVTLIVALESSFDISFDDEHFERTNFRSIRTIADLLKAHYLCALAE